MTEITYDSNVNAMYIYLKKKDTGGKATRQIQVNKTTKGAVIVLDYNSKKELLGIEILGVGRPVITDI